MAYYLLREDELSTQVESTYGTKPGSPAAGDYFKHTSTRLTINRITETYYRDKDRDLAQASVKNVQIGRQKSTIGIDADLIPSGNAATPTAPDTKNLWKELFGKATTLTANSTIAAGSTATIINLAGGGGAATGIRTGGGDIIVVDTGGTFGLEARRVVSRSTDAVTLDRALGQVPANAQNVYCGTTYQLDITQLASLHLWLWNGALKYRYPGVILNQGGIKVDFSQRTPVATQSFSGEAQPEAANADTRATPTTAGNPLVPASGKIWLGATKAFMVNAMFSLKNGYELRDSESDALQPNAVKRTGNGGGRYVVEQELDFFFTDTMQTFYDASRTLTAIDTICQLGNSPGNIVVWSCPKWQPIGNDTDFGTEIGLKLLGRALGTSGDDEISLAFV